MFFFGKTLIYAPLQWHGFPSCMLTKLGTMKKLLFLSLAAAISLNSIAQGNSGKSKKNDKHHSKDYKKEKKNDDKDGEWRDDHDRDDNNNNGTRNNQNNQGDNNRNGNAPRRVRDAFYSDYPNAGNVRWTKDRGIWTAHFRGGGLFGGNDQSVSYRANGQRLNNNTATTRRRTETNSRTNDRRTSNPNQNKPTIFDKVRNRNN